MNSKKHLRQIVIQFKDYKTKHYEQNGQVYISQKYPRRREHPFFI